MAKKKSTTKKRKSRSRVGNSGKDNGAIGYLTVILSTAAVSFLDNKVPMDPRIKGAIKIAGGFAIPMFSKDAKTKQTLTRIGDAMGALGTADLMKGFGMISGPAEDGNDLYISMNGPDNLDTINGAKDPAGATNSIIAGDNMSVINGPDDDDDDDDIE